MGCALKENQDGFTLVEISIVMIIIGLLIGGTFGGMKLIENMQVNKAVQDLKAIESAALTFKDTYGRLPGDIVNPAARLPNCTVAPCATAGNGNRTIGAANLGWAVMAATDENFTFWHHLQAADLLGMSYKNTIDMNFGEGQPDSPIGGGYRMTDYSLGLGYCGRILSKTVTILSNAPTASPVTGSQLSCAQLKSIDNKIDDGMISNGNFIGGWGCDPLATCTMDWAISSTGVAFYDLKGF